MEWTREGALLLHLLCRSVVGFLKTQLCFQDFITQETEVMCSAED